MVEQKSRLGLHIAVLLRNPDVVEVKLVACAAHRERNREPVGNRLINAAVGVDYLRIVVPYRRAVGFEHAVYIDVGFYAEEQLAAVKLAVIEINQYCNLVPRAGI